MLLLFTYVTIAIFTAVLASSKGRNSATWFIMGLLFSLLAFLLVACMPAVERNLYYRRGLNRDWSGLIMFAGVIAAYLIFRGHP